VDAKVDVKEGAVVTKTISHVQNSVDVGFSLATTKQANQG